MCDIIMFSTMTPARTFLNVIPMSEVKDMCTPLDRACIHSLP